MHVMTFALAVHTVAAVFLVGGLLFALLILRPSARALESSASLTLWRDSLARFLARAWVALALLLGSGHAMIHLTYGHLASAPPFVRVMLGLGLAIAVALAYLQFVPWRRFQQAVAAAGWPTAQQRIGQVRFVLAILMVLGLLTVLIGSGGRYFS
jgi:uncharacterized membrane protein